MTSDTPWQISALTASTCDLTISPCPPALTLGSLRNAALKQSLPTACLPSVFVLSSSEAVSDTYSCSLWQKILVTSKSERVLLQL